MRTIASGAGAAERAEDPLLKALIGLLRETWHLPEDKAAKAAPAPALAG